MSLSDGAEDSLVITDDAAVDGGGRHAVPTVALPRGLGPPVEAAFEIGLQVDPPSEARSIDWKRLVMLNLDAESDTLLVYPANNAPELKA